MTLPYDQGITSAQSSEMSRSFKIQNSTFSIQHSTFRIPHYFSASTISSTCALKREEM